MSTFVIVGGGPAGLATAAELARGGHRVVLVEATDRLGGMSASIDVDGVRCDLGSHRLHPVASPEVERLLVDLLGDDLQVRPRNGRIALGGKWLRFPLHPVDLAKRLPPRFALRAFGDTVRGPIRARRMNTAGTSDTFADVVERGLGPAMLEWFYGPYAEQLWGVPPDELAGDLARRRIANSSPTRLARKLFRAARGHRPEFRYPRNGYGQVVEMLAARATDAGAELITGERVIAMRTNQHTLSVELMSGRVLEADRVFWTGSPSALADLHPDAPDHSYRPKHRAMVCAFLTFAGERVTPYDAHYLPGRDTLPTRVSEPMNYRLSDADPPNLTVLCAEIPCAIGDEVWTAEAVTLGERVADDLARLGVTDRRPIATHIERLPHVYPVIGPGDIAQLRRLLDWAHGLDGVTVLGRQGLVVADNLHHVLDMALTASRHVGPDGSWDAPGWAEALARFDENVVED